MILNDIELFKLMKKPRNGEAISAGVTLQNKHKLHITGEGYLSQVLQVKGFENSNDYNVRKQISKPATIQITSICLDNLNRWATAQGTVKRVDFKDTAKNDRFDEVLSKCWHDQSFDEFIKTFYKEAIYTDFNGFAVVTKPKRLESGFVQKEGIISKFEGVNLDPYIIFIAASDVYDFLLTGNKTEYLIITIDKGKGLYRVIDDEKDMIITYNDKQETKDNEILHNLGYVPAIKVSNLNDKLLNDQVKTSPIGHAIPALDRYFSCDSDLRMQFIKHNYPKLAIVVRECKTCHGSGSLDKYVDGVLDMETKIKCNTCDGTGKEIPITRDGVIGLPSHLDQGDTAYPGAPASYITPETQSLQLGIDDLKQQREDIIYSATGDKNLIAESLNTATENTINNRSLEDRISEIASMVEWFEMFIKKAIKDQHKDFTAIKDYSITVKYGRRITTKGEIDLLKEIKEAKEAGLPMSYIQGLHKDLIYTKYKNNQDELQRYLILADVEPFAAFSLKEIQDMSEYIDQREIEVKANFDSLVDQLENTGIAIQYIAQEKNYKERINLIKQQLYEILSKQQQRPDWDRRPSMESANSKYPQDGGGIPGAGGDRSTDDTDNATSKRQINFQRTGTS